MGNYIAVAHNAAPFFTLLNHTTPGNVSLAATYTLPGLGYATDFSPDGKYIAVAHLVSPFFTLLNHTTPGSVSLAATYTLPGGGRGTSFSPDGKYITVVQAATPYFTLLNHTTPGSVSLAATYTLSGTGIGVRFSPDGKYIAVAHGTTPFFTLLNHTTAGSVSLAATYTLASVGYATDFSPDGNYIAVAHDGSPFFTLLNHTTPGSVSMAATYTLPGGGRGTHFSPDGKYITVVQAATPYFTLLNHTTPGSVSLAATYTLTGGGRGTSFSPDGKYITVAHDGSPYFTLLNHTTPGSVSLAATYTLPGVGLSTSFSPALSEGPPELVSAASDSRGRTIILTFNKAMANPAGKHAQFSATVNSVARSFSAAALDADPVKINLTLTGPGLVDVQPVVVSYTPGDVAAADGSPLLAFAASVANNGPPGLSINLSNPSDGVVEQGYSFAFTATGGNVPYAFTVTTGTVPPGLGLAGDGSLTGTPTATGTWHYSVTVTDGEQRWVTHDYVHVAKEAPVSIYRLYYATDTKKAYWNVDNIWTLFATLRHGLLDELDQDTHPHYLDNARHDTTTRHTLGTVVPHDDHGNLSAIGTYPHAEIDGHINNVTNPHGVTAVQTGAAPVVHMHSVDYYEPVTNGDPASPALVFDLGGDVIMARVSTLEVN